MHDEQTDPLENILFISIPAELAAGVEGFDIDPSVLLPVEMPQGADEWQPSGLTWEMIVAGMLKVLAYRPGHEDADYFRSFVMAVRPTLVDELTETAVIKARNGDYDVAEEIFLALDGLLPEEGRTKLNLALLHEQRAESYKQKSNEEMADEYSRRAFEAYKHALATDPTIPEIHFNAAFFFLRNANYDRAREHFLTYLQLGDDETKRAEAKKAVDEIEAHNLLDTMFREAYDLIRMNREEEGIAKIRQFLASSPDVWNGWFLLGWAHRRLGRYTEARDAFQKAVDLGSTETDTLNELSICHMELGDFDAAYRRLTQALRQEPENVKVISNLGILSMKRDEIDEALGYFRAALEIEPEDPIAQRYLDYLTRERT